MNPTQKYNFFTAKEIRPAGWLKRQLEIQAAGLTGHLDEIWPDVADSRWIGGSRDGWERVPYWLDGFIPLAFLLEDEGMQARARRYIDAILERQQPDGWICPCPVEERDSYDMWALFLIGKVLTVWHDCTGDPRVEPVLYAALQNFRRHIDGHTLFGWANARWYECLIPIYWLYDRCHEDWLLELAQLLAAEGMDYVRLYRTLPLRRAEGEKYWSFQEHVVNTAMALKAGALDARLTGEDPGAAAEQMLALLMKRHGTAAGHFTGDECLSGNSPTQGTELCGVVEAMYSYEWLLAVTGEPVWGDRLERLAFNCLPAATSPDMWTHQYDQMANQPECSRIPEEDVHFSSNNGEAHLFGLEPHFGCCTANFGQGWPKFALSSFLRSAEGIAVAALIPAKLRTTVGGVPVEIETESEYPFRDRAAIVVRTERPVSFELAVRIPATAVAAVDGSAAAPGFYPIQREWEGETRIEVTLSFPVEVLPRPNEEGGTLYAVQRGPLTFALPVREEWIPHEYVRDGVERKFPYCDYEVRPLSKWNYGFCGGEPIREEREIGPLPFSPEGAPVILRTQLAEIPWRSQNGIPSRMPKSCRAVSEPEEAALIPYGCTNLRMTELPMAELESDR